MKIHPSNNQSKFTMLKTISLGASALALTIGSASAALTYDLRVQPGSAAGSGIVTSDKGVFLGDGAAGTVIIQVWAQITGAVAAGPANQYGVGQVIGSVITSASGAGAIGALGAITGATGFTQTVAPGTTNTELSAPADSIKDLGILATNTLTGQPAVAKDLTINGGGTLTGSLYLSTNVNPGATTNNAIAGNPNGWEFLMGRITLTISNYTSGSNNVNWAIAPVTLLSNRQKRGYWTEGDGFLKQGDTVGGLLVGAPIFVGVPEPSAFGMVLVGALSMVGFRRFGLRRQS